MIVYAGGIVILILFVLMLVGSERLDARAYRTWVPYAGIGLGVILAAALSFAMFQTPLTPATIPANAGGIPEAVGMYLYSQGILLIELAAVLLLVALLGALLLARRPKEEHV